MSIIDRISEKFLWCRDVRHAWDPYTAAVKRSKVTRRNEMHQVLLCARCGSLKTRFLAVATGEELRKPRMKYPEGYLLKDQGPMTPADRAMIRRHNIRTAFKDTEAEE